MRAPRSLRQLVVSEGLFKWVFLIVKRNMLQCISYTKPRATSPQGSLVCEANSCVPKVTSSHADFHLDICAIADFNPRQYREILRCGEYGQPSITRTTITPACVTCLDLGQLAAKLERLHSLFGRTRIGVGEHDDMVYTTEARSRTTNELYSTKLPASPS